jgi:hypothetical protein
VVEVVVVYGFEGGTEGGNAFGAESVDDGPADNEEGALYGNDEKEDGCAGGGN